MTVELKRSNDNLVVTGKLILYLSTNTNTPITNPGPSQATSSSNPNNTLAPVMSNLSLSRTSSNQPGAPLTATTTNGTTGAATTVTNPGAAAAVRTNGDLSPFEDQHGPLPPGWERRVDHLGRNYYVSHET